MMFDEQLLAIIISVAKALLILVVVVGAGAFMSFIERRLLGLWQDRYGPNRVGPGGIFQLVADMLKMFFKEDWIPPFADRRIFVLAPIIAFTAFLMAFVIVPITPTWGVADLNIGVLYFFAIAGLAVYAVLFAGWSSNNNDSGWGYQELLRRIDSQTPKALKRDYQEFLQLVSKSRKKLKSTQNIGLSGKKQTTGL